MAEIYNLSLITKHDLNAAAMLKAIAKEKPTHAFVIVWPEDGSRPTYHSTTSDMPVVLLRLQEFTHKYFMGHFEDAKP